MGAVNVKEGQTSNCWGNGVPLKTKSVSASFDFVLPSPPEYKKPQMIKLKTSVEINVKKKGLDGYEYYV